MKYITKEVRIGIAGIAALCILVYGINYLKGIHMFKPSSYFYVKFHNVNGLTKSSPVFADGFRVGIVRDLYYDYTQPGKVVAEIDVNTDLRIPKGYSDLPKKSEWRKGRWKLPSIITDKLWPWRSRWKSMNFLIGQITKRRTCSMNSGGIGMAGSLTSTSLPPRV